MLQKLKKIIAGIDADYADLRYEIKTTTKVRMSKGEVKETTSNSGDGFVLRVLKNGGFATICFTREEDADEAIKKVLDNAQMIAENQDNPTKMAAAPVVKDSYKPELIEDPRDYSIEDKIALVKHYSDLYFTQPKVLDASVWYSDVIREKYFVNSEGSEIFEELVSCYLEALVYCKEGDRTEEGYLPMSSSNGLWKLRNRDEDAIKTAKIAHDLLFAENVKGGTYDVILDSSMTGIFIHETIGHLSEADNVENNPSIRQKMQLGTKLGSDILNIIDDANMPDQIACYKYDDEGVEVKRVNLMTNGVITGRLHNRFTAAEFNEPLTGHNIATGYEYDPIIRSGCTFVHSGESLFDDLLKQLNNGLYLCGYMSGMSSGDDFNFAARWGYKVENGKITRMIKACNMSGNIFETLKNITAIGNDLKFNEVNPCSKQQLNLRCSEGGPHILIKNITVGGNV
ncbi:MAG: TldD/PmbA family protein [Candidatus Delongbacteria bacterium]|nr:TldD/PmbA family protein [Candidatus Delongbacteria bacterium]MBN2836810.1 TldD/PmbA family protein [Candidatus Delongbacteria bacterium]